MSDQQNPTDTALSRLDSALARIDSVIETVSRRLDQSRQDRQSLTTERDKALADLADLRQKHDALQARADHAASRIDTLIGIVEKALLDGAQPAADHGPHPDNGADAAPHDGGHGHNGAEHQDHGGHHHGDHHHHHHGEHHHHHG